MVYIYNTLLFFYFNAIVVSSLFNKKAKEWVKGRKDLFKKLESEIEPGSEIAWFHCASLGEFEQGSPLIESFRENFPEFKILLTFFSPSGYEVRKNYPCADYIFYLPTDTKRNARKFISIINPKMVFFIKYEFWYHFLNELTKKQVPVFLASGIFRKDHFFFRWYGSWYRNILKNFKQIFIQDERSGKLLDSIGLTNHIISGDTRFDRVFASANKNTSNPVIERFLNNPLSQSGSSNGAEELKKASVLIAGSTWQIDEKLLVKLINNCDSGKVNVPSNLKFIIAPHEINEENIRKLISEIKPRSVRYSELNSDLSSGKSETKKAKVLIIDNIGLLSGLYQYGDIAYIGGGFGAGIHNILEAAAFGIPVVFGPNYHKFREAVELIEKGGAFSINNYTEFVNNVRFLFSNEYVLKMASELSRFYVRNNKGATQRIIDKVREFVPLNIIAE